MKMLSLAVLLISTSAFAQTETASVTGTWKIHSTVAGNESDSICIFVEQGSDLSGTCRSDQGESKLSGKVEGRKLTWSYSSDYNGTTLTIKYSGSVTGDKMSGDTTVDPFGISGDFTATRTK